jgi:hypothetical protein
MASGGQIIGKPGGVVEPGVMYYGRRVISGVTDGVELAKPKDGKKFQLRTKDKTYLFKTEKQLVDFFNKNIKKGSGAQKTTLNEKGENFKKFFKDKKIYSRYYNGPLNASSIDKIWLNLTAGEKQQAELLFKTKNKNITETAKLTKQGYTKLDDLAEKLGRSSGIELMRSMENPGSKFKEKFPNFLEKNVVKSTAGNTWIKTTPSSLEKLKTWADSDARKGLRPKTIENVQAAYKNNKLMNYWKNWKLGTPIDQVLVDSVHGAKGSANTMMQLARTLQGKEPIEGVRKNVALGNKIMEAVRYKAKEFGDWHTAAYQYAKQDMDNFIPVGKSGNTFNDYYRMLTKSLKEAGLEGFQIDEINALRAGVRGGTQPYSVFSQVLEGKYNMGVKRRFDSQNSQNQNKLSKALAMGDNETIKVAHRRSDFPKIMNKKQYIDYVMTLQNEQVDNFFKKVPELKGKISLPKFDLRDPKTVYGSRFDTFDKGIQNAILKNFKEVGYTVDVGKKALTQKELLKKLEAHGCKGKAAGGRILFSNGGEAITTCAKKGVTRFIDDLKKGNYSKATVNILKGGGNVLKNILDPKELLKLRNYFGPVALGFMAAYEGGVITDDVIRQGTPLNESLANNWLTKSFLPYTKQYAQAKNLLESGTVPANMKKYVEDVVTFNEGLKEVERIENMTSSRIADVGGYGMLDGSSMYSKKQEDKDVNNLIKKMSTISEDVVTPGTAKALEMKALQDESEATRMAKKEFSPFFGFSKLKDVRTKAPTGILDYMDVPDPKETDLRQPTYLDAEYENVKTLPSAERKRYEDFFTEQGILQPRQSLSELKFGDSNVYDEILEDYNKFQRQEEASKYPGYFGTQDKFMEGGIASLNVKK